MSDIGTVSEAGYEIISPEFKGCIIPHAQIERIWTGGRWTEGPAWFPAGRYLIWSDIPNNRILRFDETDGSVSEFRNPSNNSNGNAVDNQGRLVSCEHLSRRVTRTEIDGSITIITDQFEGKKYNSPNDLVVKTDGSVWFTDPDYGILSDYEGRRARSEIGACHVYRWDPQTNSVAQVATDYMKPNGLAFSEDETRLFVADTGGSHIENGPAHMRCHAVSKDGKSLSEGRLFSECKNGFYDGFRVDRSGRIWTSAADGVHCLDTKGDLIGKILLPEITSNVCFGGPKLNRLFITATTSVYSVFLNVNGVK